MKYNTKNQGLPWAHCNLDLLKFIFFLPNISANVRCAQKTDLLMFQMIFLGLCKGLMTRRAQSIVRKMICLTNSHPNLFQWNLKTCCRKMNYLILSWIANFLYTHGPSTAEKFWRVNITYWSFEGIYQFEAGIWKYQGVRLGDNQEIF